MKSLGSSLSLGGMMKASGLLPVLDFEDILLVDMVEEEFSGKKMVKWTWSSMRKKREDEKTKWRKGKKKL